MSYKRRILVLSVWKMLQVARYRFFNLKKNREEWKKTVQEGNKNLQENRGGILPGNGRMPTNQRRLYILNSFRGNYLRTWLGNSHVSQPSGSPRMSWTVPDGKTNPTSLKYSR